MAPTVEHLRRKRPISDIKAEMERHRAILRQIERDAGGRNDEAQPPVFAISDETMRQVRDALPGLLVLGLIALVVLAVAVWG